MQSSLKTLLYNDIKTCPISPPHLSPIHVMVEVSQGTFYHAWNMIIAYTNAPPCTIVAHGAHIMSVVQELYISYKSDHII